MGYQIITIHEKEKWMNCVKDCIAFDFYHTWQYHSIEKEGEPILFSYSRGEVFILLPLIKRRIEDTDLFDVTSVYGYAGPISNKPFDKIDESVLDHFKQSLLQYMKKEKIICLFSRLHPIIDQTPLLNKFGGMVDTGRTVFIDLDIPLEVQRSNYRKGHRNTIRSLRSKNFTIREASGKDDIALFVSIYTENMKRINAADSYFFKQDYFENLINAKEFKAQLLLVYLDNKAIAGGFFTYTSNIIQVHLLATRTDYLHESPVKLLIDEVSIMGRDTGMKYLHIGGGVGGKNDSLFYWKSGFSDSVLNFQTWRFITDPIAYNQQVHLHTIAGKCDSSKTNFFPLYRNTVSNELETN